METSVDFSALDGRKLSGIHYASADPPHTALVINSGTAIPQRFYARFAKHAAEKGFAVLTYDYRGIGASAPKSLRGYAVNYRDWGQLDISGAIQWMRQCHPNVPLAVVGHSTGGQQIGFAANADQIQAAVFVAVSTGYWLGMPLGMKIASLILWKLYVPLTSAVFGYMPAKPIGLGEDLPTGVAKEWGAWCMQHDYCAAYFDDTGRHNSLDGKPFGELHFDKANFPILAYSFTDDPIATAANIPELLKLYTHANIEQRVIDNHAVPAKKIGHLGFFKSGMDTTIWDEALEWLIANTRDRLPE